MFAVRQAPGLLALLLISMASRPAAAADSLTVDEIKRALSPPATRSLSVREPEQAHSDEQFLDTLRNKPTASLTSDDRAKLASVKGNKPSIDLEMQFPYNSDVLRAPAQKTATMLGQAIASAEFKDKTFLIAGYTDARGNEQFNQKLSERRADAVKRYLVQRFHVNAGNLIAVGYGKADLKNPGSPFAAENRRVQTVNILPFKSAHE